MDDPPPLERIVEALLFVGGAPLTYARAAEAVRGLSNEQFSQCIAGLNQTYRAQGRPYRVIPREGGHELALRPDFLAVRERLMGGPREVRLTQAGLDVLALVAYRQPITRTELDALLGADSLPQLRQLVRLGLVAVTRGEEDAAYTTTTRFLQELGLSSLDDLPRVEDIQT